MFKINFLLLLLIVLISVITITQCTDDIQQFDDKGISGDEEFVIDEADENNININKINNNNAEQSGDDPYKPLQIIEPKLTKTLTKKVEGDDIKKIRKNPPFPLLKNNDEHTDDRNHPHFIHSNKMIPIIP